MLEEAADQRAYADSSGKTGHAGPQAAESADDQVDFGPGLGCGVERLDDFGVDQAVDLEDDATAARTGGFAPDHADDVGAQAHRRDQEPAESTLAAVAGEEVVELGDVRAQLGVRREQA